MQRALISRSRFLGCLAVLVPVSLSGFIGCDDSSKSTAPVQDTAKHGEATSKNMENFMKNKAAEPKEAAKPQTK
jgi:hypothetical protein